MVFGILFGVTMVMAEQTPEVEVLGTVDFTLDTVTLDYGQISSGAESVPKDTLVTIGTNNNVELLLTITLTEPSVDNIFENIYYNLDTDPDYESQLNVAQTILLADAPADETRTDTLQSVLRVPAGTAPLDTTGTITFIATANPPVTG